MRKPRLRVARIVALCGVAISASTLVTCMPSAFGVARNKKPTTTTRRASSLALGMSMNNSVNVADFGVIAEVVSASPPVYNSPDGRPFAETPAAVPFLHREVLVRVTRLLFGSVKPGERLSFFFAGTGKNDGAPLVKFEEFTLRENYGSGPTPVGAEMLILAKKSTITVFKGPDHDGYQPVEGWRGAWVLDGGTARSLDPLRTVDASLLEARIRTERAFGRDPGRDFSERDVLATERTTPPTTLPRLLVPPPNTAPTPEAFRTQIIAEGPTWRVEYGVSSDQLVIRVFEAGRSWFTGQTYSVRDGQVVGPPDHAGLTCSLSKDGTRISIAVVDTRASAVELRLAGEVWRTASAGVIAVVGTSRSDNPVAELNDGRRLTARCAS